ncbi:cupredoxin domain-containing protein [Halomicrobium urmianum]|uniref:cupredoxin domain-containing protein n=1 Tax=Halomicrobium urmianum TaxID=1586233 RepID=UPI001CDA21FF|nr:plastocyanin/azurin family copper-binding protein [Halomicrobium urmianum]
MSNDNEQTDDGRFAVDRRSMLALMGAGGASLALTGGLGSGAAQVDDGGDGGVSADRCEACIDPYTGYLVPGSAAAGTDAGGAVDDETNETATDESDGLAANETEDNESAVGITDNETADNATDTGLGNETADNATAGGAIGNETADNGTGVGLGDDEPADVESEDTPEGDEDGDGLVEPGFLDNGDDAGDGNQTGGGAQAPGASDDDEFDPAVTITMNVGDADVVFPDEEGDAADNETDAGLGNETEDNATDTGLDNESDNETDVGLGNETADNETDGGAIGNETSDDESDGLLGNESDNETDGALNDTTDEQAAAFTQQEQEGFPDFYFDPVGVRVSPGDVVAFQPQEEVHTVTAYNPRYYDLPQRIPEGAPGFSSPPITAGDTWYYQFDETGVYDLFCLPHEQFGMVVRVVVMEEDGEVPEGYDTASATDGETDDGLGNETEAGLGNETEDNETEAGLGNETDTGTAQGGNGVGPAQAGVSDIALSVFQSPEMEPGNIADQGEVAWTDLTEVESQPPAGD